MKNNRVQEQRKTIEILNIQVSLHVDHCMYIFDLTVYANI